MSGMENMLPRENQFDASLAEVREPLVDGILEIKEKIKDVIDVDKEFSRPYLELWNLSGNLAKLLKGDGEDERDVHNVVYRGMSFGLQVVDGIRSVPMETLSLKYITEIFNTTDASAKLQKDVNEYVDSRPNLASLLYVFLPDIDSTYNYHQHVKTSAGLILMLCEREQAEVYLKVQAQTLDHDKA